MKFFYFLLIGLVSLACDSPKSSFDNIQDNPFQTKLNEPIDYAKVTADDITEFAEYTFRNVLESLKQIKQNEPSFENIFTLLDEIYNEIYVAANNSFMLYWVSPDSLSRVKGFEAYQLLDSLSTSIFSDKDLYTKIQTFKQSKKYANLEISHKTFVDEFNMRFELSGIGLDPENLNKFKTLNKQISDLSSQYSNNMNTANPEIILDEAGAKGLSENLKNTYKQGEEYVIPIMNATRKPVMDNAENEMTRKAFYEKFYNRAADKNLVILDSLVHKRHELAQIMSYKTYAAYNLVPKMAKTPEAVWTFLNDLVDRARVKAKADVQVLNTIKKNEMGGSLEPWDLGYCSNQILKNKFQVDHEKIREYLPMDLCLKGIFEIYQELLGLEIKKIENPSVWHEEVSLYEVLEKGKLKGRFYLDLFPRPNKESWFYGVPLNQGRAHGSEFEVPVSMLLANFTRPTETLPSLLSHKELSTLFHEFGHIIDGLSYEGEFAVQADAKSDFVESMSQIFENWIWDYDMLSLFAKHYETGEVLPKEMFDNMLKAKNVSSGLNAIILLRRCIYDMNLYDKYDPESPVNTDDIWNKIDKELDVMDFKVEGTHYQANWIHINTHPVYMYGYLWAEVYAQDMFTEFVKNGLMDQETGIRYRKLILANGSQRDAVEAVEEFLGRPSDNKAYIKSLGLD